MQVPDTTRAFSLVPRLRPTAASIPPTPLERHHLLAAARRYVAEQNPVPPIPLEDLKARAGKIIEQVQCAPIYRDYIALLINNEMWREAMASVPYHRRLLLLPKCLREESKCSASFDEFGLLCRKCGLCSIHHLQADAERLGYAVLVAEGSAMVMSLLQTGKIDAIIGVSCMSVLERAFPYMEAAAIPGIAIPLLQDDCAETSVDMDWVWDAIHLTSADQTRRLDLGSLRDEVDRWFSPESLESIMGPAEGETEKLAREWMCRAGKRWRPFLAVAAFRALGPSPTAPLPSAIRPIAVAVECFHKASLIHDDIEDSDQKRYGEKTLHEEHGLAMALNIGDLLVGEGYRLIAAADFSPAQKAQMLLVASQGQRQLCRGQGGELEWMRSPKPLTVAQVLEIFRRKTAPAFEVALQLGAICADAPDRSQLSTVLSAYSEALGIAYQVRDDLEDLCHNQPATDIAGMRPTLLLALAWERAGHAEQKRILESLWKRVLPPEITPKKIADLYTALQADHRAAVLLEFYKQEAIDSLRNLVNPNLKGLLRRVIGKIFNDPEIRGWCNEVRNDRAQLGV